MAKEQVSSILRSLQILECFMDDKTQWTHKRLAEELHLAPTTAFRHLSTLVEAGYLEQDPIRKTYRVGPQLLMLSGAVLSQSNIYQAAHPEMERLSEQVRETINLCVLSDNEIFYLDKVETHRSIACSTRIGNRLPAHATSCGKVLLSEKSEEFLQTYSIYMEEVAPLTPYTITKDEDLRKSLSLIRQMGYATDDGEVEQGLTCIGFPIRDITGQIVAALSIAGPDYRMREEKDRMIHEGKQTAVNISRLLGYYKK